MKPVILSTLFALVATPAVLAQPPHAAKVPHRVIRLPVSESTLHVEIDGADEAPALLLWNGAYCTTRMWDAVIPRLGDRFRVIRFDVRGTGQSDPGPAESYTFEQYGRDVLVLLDHLEIERADLWAMAWGSRAALAFAALHPARVKKVALFDASIGAADTEAQRRGREEALQLQKAQGIALFERPLGWDEHRDRNEAQKAIGAARKIRLPDLVPRLEMPLLVATGDHDPNLASSREIVSGAPQAKLVVLEAVGHGSVLQRPDLTTEVFLDFVSEP